MTNFSFIDNTNLEFKNYKISVSRPSSDTNSSETEINNYKKYIFKNEINKRLDSIFIYKNELKNRRKAVSVSLIIEKQRLLEIKK